MRLIQALILPVCATLAMGATVPTTINDFFLPGSQPGQSGNLDTPDKCDNCHGGYDAAVEPAFNWRGSMMSQAARDPLFYACLAIANQDAGESGDLCIRCHSPAGWLEGRSIPTDGSALNNNDREGVQCDFCHKLIKPTAIGVNPYPGDPDYTNDTYPADQGYLPTIDAIPAHAANGMYIADSDNAKRGPFVDANAKHKMFYSPFHPESALCGTCHDVSNPAFSKDINSDYLANSLDQPAPDFDPYSQFPIERTYSEWLMSAYNTPEGVYAPQFGGNKDTVHTCQDCHLKDVTGLGCNKAGVPVRDDLPLHDMTGGNTFIPPLIETLFPGETNAEALAEGMARARGMLTQAAAMEISASEQDGKYLAAVRVTNETGHKLPSGYPEGRRLWLNIKAYNSNWDLIYESGAYDPSTGVLTHDADAKIYEIKPGISEEIASLTGYPAGPSFHFAINSKIYFDNRIPPRGFTNANFEMIQSPPIGYSYADGQYWDDTEYLIPGATAKLVVTLFYQTTSKEYVEFLRDENTTNDWGNVFYDLWAQNGKSAPEVMNIDSLLLTPLAGNQAPILATIGPKEVDEGSNLSFAISAHDPDGTIPSLTTSTLPDGATFVDHEDGTATFDWTPTYNQADVYPVTFYTTDDSAAVDSEVVSITVNNVNRAPELQTIGPKEIDENSTLNFVVSALDLDGTVPSLMTSLLPEGATFVDHEDGTATFDWTPTFDQADIYPVTFYATDDSAAVDSEVVSITVNNVNRAPELQSIGPKEVGEGNNLNFTVNAIDPDGTIPDLTAAPLPDGATYTDNDDGSAVFDWTPGFDQTGLHYVTFYATDDSAAVDSEVVRITVGDVNRPPELASIGNKSIAEGEVLSFDISAIDPDGTIPDLTTSLLPDNAAFTDNDDGSGSFQFEPDYDQVGNYPITFYASDGILIDSEEITITVINTNRAPILNPIGYQMVTVDTELSIDVSAADPDGTIPSLSVIDIPAGASFSDHDDGTGTFIWTPVAGQEGFYDVIFVASDSELEDNETVTIEVFLDVSYVCGDANGDGTVNVGDAVYLTAFVFNNGPPPEPMGAGDANADGTVNVGDIVYLNTYIFNNGPEPLCPD
jgi:hypothetical protein